MTALFIFLIAFSTINFAGCVACAEYCWRVDRNKPLAVFFACGAVFFAVFVADMTFGFYQ